MKNLVRFWCSGYGWVAEWLVYSAAFATSYIEDWFGGRLPMPLWFYVSVCMAGALILTGVVRGAAFVLRYLFRLIGELRALRNTN